MGFSGIVCVSMFLLCCAHSSEVNNNRSLYFCDERELSPISNERNLCTSILNPDKCMKVGGIQASFTRFKNGTRYLSLDVEIPDANMNRKPSSSHIYDDETRCGLRSKNVKASWDFNSASSDRQSSEETRSGKTSTGSTVDAGKFDSTPLQGSGEFDDTCSASVSLSPKYHALRSSTISVKNDGLQDGNLSDTFPSNKTKCTLLISLEGEVVVMHQRNYCPDRLRDDPTGPYFTAVIPFRVHRNGCKAKKGAFLRVERRLKSAMKKVEKENDSQIKRLLRKSAQDLKSLKTRHKEKIRIHRENFNQRQDKLQNILARYGHLIVGAHASDGRLSTEENSVLVKDKSSQLKKPMTKQELKIINVQRLNLLSLHKLEEIHLQEELQIEKNYLILLHNLMLVNFERLRLLRHQYTNVSLQMEEAKMLWSIDDLMRKKNDDVVSTMENKLEQSEMVLKEAKRQRTRIRRYIKNNNDTLSAYYKERRKEIRERYFYKTFISENDLKVYHHLMESVDKSERKDINVLLVSTLENVLRTRYILDKVYEAPEKARNTAKEKSLYDKKTIKEYTKLGLMDFEIRKSKVLKELEENFAAEKFKMEERMKLEIEQFINKKDTRVNKLNNKHREEIKKFDELILVI